MKKLNWITPNHRFKKPPIKCQFCGEDVQTPYKAIHNEVEFINGFPQPCRNNGKANIHIYMGYPKGEEPKENIKWFVEHAETHLWWTGYKWTNDPLEAFGCEFEWTADRYARFQGIENYIITEHEFIATKG